MPGRPNPHAESVTSDVALDFAHSMVRRFDVDWAGLGFTDADLDELAEHLLRIIQSFVIDPGRPPRRGDELRDYLRRWVGCRYTTVSGSDFLGSNTNAGPPLNLTTETSRNSSAAVSVSIKRAVQSVSVPVISTSRCGSTAATTACSGRFSPGVTSEIHAPSS